MPALHNIVPQSFDGLTRFLPCVPAMLAEMLLLKLTRRDAENEASTYKIEECHHDKQQINRLYMQREKDQVQRKGRKDMGHNASQHEITNGLRQRHSDIEQRKSWHQFALTYQERYGCAFSRNKELTNQ